MKSPLLFSAALLFGLCLTASARESVDGQLIFPLQDKHVHSSSIVECPNGDLLAVWFHGSGERSANDVQVQGARLKKGADSWGEIFVAADTPGVPDCNPVLFIDAQERLWLFWIVVWTNRWEQCLLKYKMAEDYQGGGAPDWAWQDVVVFKPGEAFSEAMEQGFKELNPPEHMWAEYAFPYTKLLIEASKDPFKRQTGWMTRTHPITLPSGRILVPVYSDGFNASMAVYSDDQGATWKVGKPMVGLGPIQPTIARRKDGTLVAYMRDSGDAPKRVLRSYSKDEGETWSLALDIDVPNPGSSLEVIALRDGRWVMICNPTELGRHLLVLKLSLDEGETWTKTRTLEEAEPGKGSYAYPSIIQDKSGMLRMSYSYSEGGQKSIKQVTLSPDWIEGE